MKYKRTLFLLVLFISFPFVLLSQDRKEKPAFVPKQGMPGKDVIWVPTPLSLVKALLDKAEVGPDDFLVDLGSGDGRIVIEAAKRGARATGIEFNPEMVRLSEQKARLEGVSENATFLNMDLFDYDLSQATVVSMYLLPELNLKLRPVLLELKPGTRIISNTFNLGAWMADEQVFPAMDYYGEEDGISGEDNEYSMGYFWIVPAKSGGRWKFMNGFLEIEQHYQVIHGTYREDGKTFLIEQGKMKGDQITFLVKGFRYDGKVEGDRMSGIYTDPLSSHPWEAVREP
jgi:SAM-dependent methyltransferase